MKAIDFLKKFGLEHTKYLIEDTELTEFAIHSTCGGKYYQDTVSVSDLKQIVDAFELVEKYKNRHGGIRFRIRWGMFRYGDTQEFNERLKQAINLVEQCQ